MDDDPIAHEAQRCGVSVFRGAKEDVLDRYLGAAASYPDRDIVRVTSDCPFIDPDICGDVLQLLGEADYACNNAPPTWPHGLDCEAFSFDLLARAARYAKSSYDREHVTPWMRRSPDAVRMNLSCPVAGLSHLRLTLDYPEDFQFLECVHDHFRPDERPGLSAILGVMYSYPELSNINAHRIDEKRFELHSNFETGEWKTRIAKPIS